MKQFSSNQDAFEAVRDKILYFNKNQEDSQVVASFFQGNLETKPSKLPPIEDQNFTYQKKYRSVSLSPFSSSIGQKNRNEKSGNASRSIIYDDTITRDQTIDQTITVDGSIDAINQVNIDYQESFDGNGYRFLNEVEQKKQFLKKRNKPSPDIQRQVKILDMGIRFSNASTRKKSKDLYQINRFLDHQPCNNDCSGLIQYFVMNQSAIMGTVRKRDFEVLLSLMQVPFEMCQSESQILCFQELIMLLAQFAYDCGQIPKSIYFLNQSILISERTRSYANKCRALILLSSTAKQLKLYQQSIVILKKALMYAWVTNEFEQEIACYDMLGLSHFYMGRVREAGLYHAKWALAEVEPVNNYFRNTSSKYIQFYEQTLGPQMGELNKSFMATIALPIRNIFEKGSPYCDQYRVIRYNSCDGSKIIDDLIQGIEFSQYSLEYYPRSQLNSAPSKKVRLPRRIVEIEQKYSNNKQNYKLQHDIYNNPILNADLEKRVKERQKKVFDIEKAWENVSRQVGMTRQPYGERQEQVYTKHFNQFTQKPMEMTLFQSRYKMLLQNLIKTIK